MKLLPFDACRVLKAVSNPSPLRPIRADGGRLEECVTEEGKGANTPRHDNPVTT